MGYKETPRLNSILIRKSHYATINRDAPDLKAHIENTLPGK